MSHTKILNQLAGMTMEEQKAGRETQATERSEESDSDYDEDEADDPDDPYPLLSRDAKIASQEQQKQRQDEAIAMLRTEIGSLQAKHKEELYWLRLEVENLRRDKEAADDRMAELYRDMREIDMLSDEQSVSASVGPDSGYVLHLQTQLSKSMQTMGVLDNQMTMVKSSCDEVVRSMKEEIADVMEDKCSMEMELMNQMAALDNAKRETEERFTSSLCEKDVYIDLLKKKILVLRKNGGVDPDPENLQEELAEQEAAKHQMKANGAGVSEEKLKELTDQLDKAKREKDKIHQELISFREKSSDKIRELQEANVHLEEQAQNLRSDLDVVREGATSQALMKVLDNVTRDRKETLETLERVANIWERADDAVQGLEDLMDELRPLEEEGKINQDQERALNAMETASLVHGQIKVSLLLIEIRLRNQLTSLKNDKLRIFVGNNGVSDSMQSLDQDSALEISNKMEMIEKEALSALKDVEDNMTEQIEYLDGKGGGGDYRGTMQVLQEREDQLMYMEKEYKKLQAQLKRANVEHDRMSQETKKLRDKVKSAEAKAASVGSSAVDVSNVTKEDENAVKKEEIAAAAVSQQVVARLQEQVQAVVNRVKEKNESIDKLSSSVEEHKVREQALKKELKRMMKRVRSVETGGTHKSSRHQKESNGGGATSSSRRSTIQHIATRS
eukprot:CAMPEP_0198305720 /NCGR_PEP_ID=MMETSP1449-20131203/58050_1 /TAXON_ID=420275 /ORGANISM="Attheya septentrionalis, Strain CCMP2084" /LENGTH=674 /DNA_ID=CAMNT_0044008257 /DNA_START=34 /DNA_END=2058 /DNA_ORIENTATION=+